MYGSHQTIGISTHTLRGERDFLLCNMLHSVFGFQLTRSVGSVTSPPNDQLISMTISTHTLRGERDAGGAVSRLK